MNRSESFETVIQINSICWDPKRILQNVIEPRTKLNNPIQPRKTLRTLTNLLLENLSKPPRTWANLS